MLTGTKAKETLDAILEAGPKWVNGDNYKEQYMSLPQVKIVEVHDYDIDGTDSDILTDDDGDEYVLSIYRLLICILPCMCYTLIR